MATNTLETRILLRYDTYNRWLVSDVILQPGEAAVATFPGLVQGDPPRAFGIKIGDGTRYFDELPWASTLALDVYEWAKEPQKPTYQASEIQGLIEFIQTHAGGGGGGSSASSGAYQIIYDSTNFKYILQQWNDSTSQWDDTASEINLKDIFDRIDTIERWANGARTKLGRIEMPLTAYVYEEVVTQLAQLTKYDEEVQGEYITAVSQYEGLVDVTRKPINASYINTGVLSTAHGGTGLSRVAEDELLIGSLDGDITKKSFVTTIDPTSTDNFATTGAIIGYVTDATSGLTRAMHYIGESSIVIDKDHANVNPQIRGYDFSKAQEGDVIIANSNQEFIWTGYNWHLIGQSYALKGQIVNNDIADNAAIAQSKINGLTDTLDSKVDVVEGKQLSTNDFTNEYKEKLDDIEAGAQVNVIEQIIINDTPTVPQDKVLNLQIPILTQEQIDAIDAAQENVIEHIFVNTEEITPITYKTLPKSVHIEFNPFTDEDKTKLDGIEAEAQKNIIEHIYVNGTELEPTTINDEPHSIDFTIDESALSFEILKGARYPVGNSYTDIDITNNKLELSKVAATGNIDDLIQTEGTYIILNCGTSESVM